MVLLLFKVAVGEDKRIEFFQAMRSLGRVMGEGRGANFVFTSIDSDSHFCFFTEWESREQADQFVNSGYFQYLAGAISVLATDVVAELIEGKSTNPLE